MAIAFTAGQLVTANQMNLLAPLLAVKSSPRTVTASAVLVNDNDIVFTLVANQTVEVDAKFLYQSNTTTDVGLRPAWSTTGTLTMLARTALGANDSAVVTPDAMTMQSRPLGAFTTNNLVSTASVANTAAMYRETLLLTTGASGGTLQFQWAEFTGTAATSVTMNAGTFAVARYVA
jgi:hypothetical protein